MDTRYLVDAILNAPKPQQAAPASRYGELAQALMQQAAPAFGMSPLPIPMDGSASFHQGWTTPEGQRREVEQFRQQMQPPGMALGPSWLGVDVPLAQLVGAPAAKGIENTTGLLTSFAPGISDAQAAYDAMGFFGDAIGSAGRGEWDNIAPMMAMGLTAGAGALPGVPNTNRFYRTQLADEALPSHPFWVAETPDYAQTFMPKQGGKLFEVEFDAPKYRTLDLSRFDADHQFSYDDAADLLNLRTSEARNALETLYGPADQGVDIYYILDHPDIAAEVGRHFDQVIANQYNHLGSGRARLILNPAAAKIP